MLSLSSWYIIIIFIIIIIILLLFVLFQAQRRPRPQPSSPGRSPAAPGLLAFSPLPPGLLLFPPDPASSPCGPRGLLGLLLHCPAREARLPFPQLARQAGQFPFAPARARCSSFLSFPREGPRRHLLSFLLSRVRRERQVSLLDFSSPRMSPTLKAFPLAVGAPICSWLFLCLPT